MDTILYTAQCLVTGKEQTHIALVVDPRCASGRLAIYAIVRGIWGIDPNDYLQSNSCLVFSLSHTEALQVAESLQCNTMSKCVGEVKRLIDQPLSNGRFRYWSIIATGRPDNSAIYEFRIISPHRWN